MALDESFGNGVCNHLGEQCNGADGVIVTRDRVLKVIGVSVGVQDSYDGNAELASFVDGQVLTNGVDDPDGTGRFLQGPNTTERFLQLGELTLLQQQLLLRETLSGVVVVNLFELLHATQTLGDGLEVGQETTQPALVHIGLTHAGCLLGDRLLSLLLGSHEKHRSAVRDGFLDEVIGLVNVGE